MIWKFEHRLNGKRLKCKEVEADSMEEAVSKLSDKYKGVFRYISCTQTYMVMIS